MLIFSHFEKNRINFNLCVILCTTRHWRKAMKVAHFGFPPSAGPESGRATAPFAH
jgi:hypothetical protein